MKNGSLSCSAAQTKERIAINRGQAPEVGAIFLPSLMIRSGAWNLHSRPDVFDSLMKPHLLTCTSFFLGCRQSDDLLHHLDCL